MLINDSSGNKPENGNHAMNRNRNMNFANAKETEEEEDALLVQQLQGRLSKTRWWLSLAVACNIVALLVAVLLMVNTTTTTTAHAATANTASPFRGMAFRGVGVDVLQSQPQPHASVRRQLDTADPPNPNDIEVTDTYKSDNGEHVEHAMVTVEIDGTKYFGSNQGLINAQFHVNDDGCKVYENIRSDGRDAEVICCGPGDCLMGFLTRHQWLLSWL